jgi:hypothetical protein
LRHCGSPFDFDFSLWIVPLVCAVSNRARQCAVPVVPVAKRISGVPLGMSRIHPECPDSDPCDRSAAADVVVRQEPEEEDEDEDEGDGTEDNDNDNDDGYSE